MADELREIYGGSYRRLVAQTYAVTSDRAEAERCVRAAFIQALTVRFRFSRSDDPEAWLRSRALGAAGRSRRRAGLMARLRRNPVPRRDFRDVPALTGLPEQDRAAAALAVFAALPIGEIASFTGGSLARTARQVERARTGLTRPAAVVAARRAFEDSIVPPPYDEVVHDARERRRQRRLVAATAAGVVVAVSVAVPLVVRTHPLPNGEPITQVTFSDADHGWAVRKPCVHRRCGLELARTSDGGRSWSRVRIPHEPMSTIVSAVLTTCCGNELAVDYSGRHAGHAVSGHVVSDDGGRHWHVAAARRETRIGGPVESLPAGWTLVTRFTRGGAVITATDPVDQIARPLAHQPPLQNPDVAGSFRPGLRIWATGTSLAGRSALAYSDDGGRSWSTVPAPPLRGREELVVAYPSRDGQVYAQTKRPHDGTWRTWRLSSVRSPHWSRQPSFRAASKAIVTGVLPDGELWLSDDRYGAWTTRDNGSGLVPVARPTVDGHTARLAFAGTTPDGQVYATAAPGERQDVVFLSGDDGRHWTTRVVLPDSHVE